MVVTPTENCLFRTAEAVTVTVAIFNSLFGLLTVGSAFAHGMHNPVYLFLALGFLVSLAATVWYAACARVTDSRLLIVHTTARLCEQESKCWRFIYRGFIALLGVLVICEIAYVPVLLAVGALFFGLPAYKQLVFGIFDFLGGLLTPELLLTGTAAATLLYLAQSRWFSLLGKRYRTLLTVSEMDGLVSFDALNKFRLCKLNLVCLKFAPCCTSLKRHIGGD